MQGKRKAEGIALLSFYNDDDDEEDEGDTEDDQNAPEEVRSEETVADNEQGKGEIRTEGGTSRMLSLSEIPESWAKSDSSFRSESYVKSESHIKSEEFIDRFGNGAHGIIVDYAHEDLAVSPHSEEGEFLSTGRAAIDLDIQTSNGFLEEITSPGGRILTPKNALTDDRIEESKVVISQDRTIITNSTVDMVDIDMADVDDGNTISSEIDPLADFLPPHPTERCSDELQQKFAKYLALKNAGRSFNEVLRKSKGYRNPDFLQRAVKYQEIDQIGSCFKKEIFDPHGYNPADFYDILVLEFRREQERKEQAKKQSQRADFIHGGGQTTLPEKTKNTILQIPALQNGGPVINTSATANQVIPPVSDALPKSNVGRSSKSKWDKLETDSRTQAPLPPVAKTAMAAASAHAALLSANAGGGYASFAQQKRKEAEERSRGFDKISDRK